MIARVPNNGSKPKLAEQVARRLESDIAERGWPVGEVIGSEADLLSRYGVSRAVLREAVRLLEFNRVAQMRRGPGGGLVVQAPAAAVAAEAIATYFTLSRITIDELTAARASIERATVSLAAERIDERGIARLRELVDPHGPHRHEDHPLHIAIAEISGNEALVIFVAALSRAGGRRTGGGRSLDHMDERAAELMLRAHRGIADAIIAGDGASAQQRMTDHLDAAREWLRGHPRSRAEKQRLAEFAQHEPSTKLAARLAEEIKDDIAAQAADPGAFIASETELIERYGVSRAVFREAVRILEHNGVARMRRGPGGGLVAGEADPTRVLDVVTNYLRYAGLERRVIYDARCAVELPAVEAAALHIDDTGREALEAELIAEERVDSDDVARVGDLHVLLAELSGNRALAFFVHVMTRLTAALVPRDERTYPPDTRAAVMRVHRRIVEAVDAGDPSLARHRMLRHLDALAPWISEDPQRQVA